MTNEFNTPTAKTRKTHSATPEKIVPFELLQPSGEAKVTGTPTTSRKETAIKAKRAS